jgi:hypothetical protein
MNEGNQTAPVPDGPPAASEPRAWQPFTPRGIAAFASVGWGRLLVVQMLMGLIAGGFFPACGVVSAN